MEKKPDVERCRYWKSSDCKHYKRPCLDSVCEAYEEKLSRVQIFGLMIFLVGLATVISTYFAFIYQSSIFLIGFSAGLVMIALGGGLVIVYENRNANKKSKCEICGKRYETYPIIIDNNPLSITHLLEDETKPDGTKRTICKECRGKEEKK